MTYKELINRFKTAAQNHKMIQDFGYGQISDIKTGSQLGEADQEADYPYMFLNSTTSQRTGSVMNYTFNMIMMDMTRNEAGDDYSNYITVQSDCQQYIDDILAYLKYYYTDQPEVKLTGISYTPFKEKYQDELAGMTASITVEVPRPLNECTAPFASVLAEARSTQSRVIDPDNTAALRFDETIIANSQLDITPQVGNIWTPTEERLLRFTLEGEVTFAQPQAGQLFPDLPKMVQEVPYTFFAPMTNDGWPIEWESSTKVYPFKLTWDILNGPAGQDWTILFPNQVGDDSAFELLAGYTYEIKEI
jgi:hypothetical protein